MDVLQNPTYSYLLGKQSFYYRIFKTLFFYYSKMVFSAYAPMKVYGKENIPKSSYIFCSNHNSHMDVAVLAVSANKDFNNFGMLAARDYWFDSWLRRTAVNTVMNLIPVDRKSNNNKKLSVVESQALCNAFMSYGDRSLILFPEGTRGKAGKILPFKSGAARFSIGLNRPIVPAVIYGSHKIWPRGKIFFGPPTKMNVYILEPIYPKTFLKSSKPTEEELAVAIKEMTKTLEEKIRKKAVSVYG